MASGLNISKIKSQRGIPLSEAAKLVSDLDWVPTYAKEAAKYPTDYKITKGS